MNLTGSWKPFGRLVIKDQNITIKDQELTFWTGVTSPNPKQTTVHFHLVEERCLRENNCYNLEIEEKEFKNTDFMVHEETIEGKPVLILSNMCMEYDGRGRIVFFSYVREEDYSLIKDDFKSLAYQYWNERPSVPTMQMNPNVKVAMGMMGDMANMPGMMYGMQALANATTSTTQVEPWDCICGTKQITTKFCRECGMPMPKQ